ncbi:MAG TPA: MBL fold metallo-hydrolase [Candidatus Paceibacterota bacterium]|jgi:L-ascorbate metabolism protein UlaG (beta-lactamase superfamily)
MRITKYGHACLFVEEEEARILIDPGNWNAFPDAQDIHVVLITHEHQDHLDVTQLKEVLAKNPNAVVITHEDAGKVLLAAGIPYLPIVEGGRADIKGVCIQSIGSAHAIIYGDTSPCRNTGFLINARLYVPGDALHDVPASSVDVLALPTGAPWMKLPEAIDYAKALKPKVAFPIHDAMYTEEYRRGLVPKLVGSNLAEAGIDFRDLSDGDTLEC